MEFSLRRFEDIDPKDWDAFVLQSEYGSIHQVAAWKGFQEKVPGRSDVRGYVTVDEEGRIHALTWCVRMETGKLGTYWYYSARGPVFNPGEEKEAGEFLVQEVYKDLAKTKALFWRIDPYFSAQEYKQLILGKPRLTTQNYQPTDTLVLNLELSDEELLAQMKRKGRYNINLARKNGVEVEKIKNATYSQKDLEDFAELNGETTTRDKFASHSQKYYEHFLHELKSYATLFFATYKGQRIATAISTYCGGKAIYYFGASTSNPEYRNLMAPYLLQWEMMQEGRKKGCKTYDFLGIAPENEPNHPYAGISEFKWKFGGERQTFAPGREFVFRPAMYFCYRIAKKLR